MLHVFGIHGALHARGLSGFTVEILAIGVCLAVINNPETASVIVNGGVLRLIASNALKTFYVLGQRKSLRLETPVRVFNAKNLEQSVSVVRPYVKGVCRG